MADSPHRIDETLFGAAFDAMPDAACILEPVFGRDGAIIDWRCLAANRRIGEFLGLTDVVGKTLHTRWPKMAPLWMEEFAQVLASGSPLTVIRKGSEDDNTYETTLSPITFARAGRSWRRCAMPPPSMPRWRGNSRRMRATNCCSTPSTRASASSR